MNEDSLCPIRVICEQSGINPATLRAWERRYGLFVPHRTPKGHRLYTEADIDRVKKIQFFLSQGYAIREVQDLLKEAPKSMATVNAVKSEVSVDFVRLKKGLHDLNSLLVYHELGHLISEYGPELFATQVYPQMLNNFDLTLWPKHPWPEMGHQLLLDLLTDRLKQFLLHAKPAKHQKVIIVLGYRSGMISKRIIQALLLANILSAHGMRIIFTSSVQNLENIVDIAKQHSKSLVITSSSIDGFYQNLLLNTLGESGQKNIMAYAPKWPDKNSHCLPEDLAKVFAVVKKAMEEL